MPLAGSFYQTNIMISAMLYIMLALGLNIVVGLAGQLVLGYVAFYAVGAYAYGLLNQFFGWGFWMCLPVGGLLAALFGLGLGFPVLRLRGDYLAIVTLGFGEIVRLGLLNWTSLTGGPRGISEIPRPGLFGLEMGINESTIYIYYLVLAAVAITVAVISRLKNSRVGLALQALREDEIACEAMGIDITRVKLSAFALGSCWAGFAGVIFAAKTTFINPSSFTFMESAMILSMVVLGGMGSIAGVIIAAVITWVRPDPYNPIVRTLRLLTEPVFYRVRKWLPFTYSSGLEFSSPLSCATASWCGRWPSMPPACPEPGRRPCFASGPRADLLTLESRHGPA